jgi:hypothetical protein
VRSPACCPVDVGSAAIRLAIDGGARVQLALRARGHGRNEPRGHDRPRVRVPLLLGGGKVARVSCRRPQGALHSAQPDALAAGSLAALLLSYARK